MLLRFSSLAHGGAPHGIGHPVTIVEPFLCDWQMTYTLLHPALEKLVPHGVNETGV
jgi:hypothetical protein